MSGANLADELPIDADMKRYLDILKKHYEKFILSIVLLGLAGAVGYLPFKIATDRQELRDQFELIKNRPVKELPPLDTTVLDKALAETKEPFDINLAAPPHNTVNPVEWHRSGPSGPLKRSSEHPIGVSLVEIGKVTPLNIIVTWVDTREDGTGFTLQLQDQTPVRKINKSGILEVGKKLGPFTLKEARTNASGAQELVCEFTDTQESFTLQSGIPYSKVAGYMIDFKYEPKDDPEKVNQRDQRVGASFRFAGGEQTISAINPVAPGQYEVVFSTKSTGQKTKLKYSAVPQP
jgi:hypothetical protein